MYLTRMMMRGRCIPYSLPQEGVLLKLSSWNDPFLFFFFDDVVFDDDEREMYTLLSTTRGFLAEIVFLK